MFKKGLLGVFGVSSENLPFKLGEEVTSFSGKTMWKLYKGTRLTTTEEISIFVYEKNKQQPQTDARVAAAQNMLTRLKTVRHPHVLRYLDGVETSSAVYIATESITPLNLDNLSKMAAADLRKEGEGEGEGEGDGGTEKRNLLISLGLFQLGKALSFVNTDCKMLHGNVQVTSIFVTPQGDWKLGGFEVCGPLPTSSILKDFVSLPPREQSPEVVERQWSKLDAAPPHAMDSWGIGCVIYTCFNGVFSSAKDLGKPQHIPPSLLPEYKRLLVSNCAGRANPNDLLNSNFFNNDLVNAVAFLDELALKGPAEKVQFFARFAEQVPRFPVHSAKYKILPQLLNALQFGTASTSFASILSSVLKIGAWLSETEYSAMITPCVVKLFSSNERSVRVHLLQNLKDYHASLGADLVNKEIFPQLISGFTDSAPTLRELTVKSMSFLAPKLGAKTVEQRVLKFLQQTLQDPEETVRTNTTYCLAKIAPYIPPESREKVLVGAFARAIRDTFPPCRHAAALSFTHTLMHFTADVCCRKVLPLVSPSCLDPVKVVREASLQCVSAILDRLVKNHEELSNLPDPAIPTIASTGSAPTGTPSGSANTTSSDESGGGVGASSLGALGGVVGMVGTWAVNSAVSTIVASASKIQQANSNSNSNSNVGFSSNTSSSSTARPSSSAMASASSSSLSSTSRPQPQPQSQSQPQSVVKKPQPTAKPQPQAQPPKPQPMHSQTISSDDIGWDFDMGDSSNGAGNGLGDDGWGAFLEGGGKGEKNGEDDDDDDEDSVPVVALSTKPKGKPSQKTVPSKPTVSAEPDFLGGMADAFASSSTVKSPPSAGSVKPKPSPSNPAPTTTAQPKAIGAGTAGVKKPGMSLTANQPAGAGAGVAPKPVSSQPKPAVPVSSSTTSAAKPVVKPKPTLPAAPATNSKPAPPQDDWESFLNS